MTNTGSMKQTTLPFTKNGSVILPIDSLAGASDCSRRKRKSIGVSATSVIIAKSTTLSTSSSSSTILSTPYDALKRTKQLAFEDDEDDSERKSIENDEDDSERKSPPPPPLALAVFKSTGDDKGDDDDSDDEESIKVKSKAHKHRYAILDDSDDEDDMTSTGSTSKPCIVILDDSDDEDGTSNTIANTKATSTTTVSSNSIEGENGEDEDESDRKSPPPPPPSAVAGFKFTNDEEEEDEDEVDVDSSPCRQCIGFARGVNYKVKHIRSSPSCKFYENEGRAAVTLKNAGRAAVTSKNACTFLECPRSYADLYSMYRHFRTFHWEELAEDGSSEEHDIPIYKPMITETVACTFLECPQSYVGLCLMWRHFRLSHSEELAEDRSSKEHGIPTVPPPPITRPNSLKSHITEKHYQYIVKMVGRHIEHAIINLKFTAHHEYLKSLLADPIARHKLAKEIVEVLIEKTMLTADAIDDAGGNLPDGIILEPYGGVLRLTLDRKDNNLPHFLEGLPVAENIHFVALGMNTSANIVCLHGPDTCKKLRAKVEESKRATPESLDIIVSEQQDARCYDENKLYCTSAGVYRKENDFYKQYKSDKKMVTDGDVVALEKFNSKYPTEVVEAMNQFRLEFPTPKSVYDFGLSLLTKKKGKCAISKFLMVNDKGNNIYQPSLDAIFPNQRHVKSNLRLICRFLNSTNVSKCSKDGQTDSGWTPAVFSSYIALPAQDKINN